ncbi:MAG: porin [Parvibaculum sp.]|uniref:porin n=1 Tax=Parvibaculum sp. TaxID=2024848 RepID=UPI003C75F687
MKKTLLGTTALVAVGLLAGPALASDPLKVTVGGNVVTGFYVIDADNVGATSFEDTKVALVARNIDIKAEGTLDNGLVAGVDAKLQLGSDFGYAAQGDATFRQLFAYLEGGFGRFEMGGTDGAAYKMHYTSPWFVPGNGVDSPNIYNGHGVVRASTFSLLATNSNKVSYFTPRLAGFQLGASYTPEVSSNTPSQNGLGLTAKGAANVAEVFEVAANYAGTFGGVDVGVDGFYVSGQDRFGNGDPEEYGIGANLGYAGFTLGGAWYKGKDTMSPGSATTGSGTKVWTAGLKYATGPWTVGVAYLKGEGQGGASGAENKSWQVGGGYSLGSGVDLGLDLQLNKVDFGAGEVEAKSAGLVLAVAF